VAEITPQGHIVLAALAAIKIFFAAGGPIGFIISPLLLAALPAIIVALH